MKCYSVDLFGYPWYYGNMQKTFTQTVIKIGNEPLILMPLRKWEEIQETLDDLEDARRYEDAFQRSLGEKKIGLRALQKKYGL